MGTNTAILHSSFFRRSMNPHSPSPSPSPCFSNPIKFNCREECWRTVSMQHQHLRRSVKPRALPGAERENGAYSEEQEAEDEQFVQSCSSSPPSPSSAIDFLTLCQLLKTTKRTGWVNHGIQNAESIADHMYRMAAMALIVADVSGINRDRCVKMAIVHDIAEAIVGDITPSDGIPKEEKSRREREALDEMCKLLGEGVRAAEIRELWNEYENNSSPEANMVKDFDKVELILQALEYETEHGKILDEFFESTTGKFQTDVGKAWAAEILARRRKRIDHACKEQYHS